jgi:betaine-aldehyde dehydrogenase
MPLHYINGKFTRGSGTEELKIHNPATEELLDTVPRGTAQDAESALVAARDAFPTWKRTPANTRAHLMHEAAAKMRAHKDKIVRLLTLEEGKPVPENEEELGWLTNTFDYYAI